MLSFYGFVTKVTNIATTNINSFFNCFYFDAGQLAISQYPEGPATGHLDTGFSWFP